ncbi:MAG: hypothetical protein NC489_19295 [Ruminococcus flavefaciens]|nr:hypothetical protein [Ruminococcus flavefaciens]
MIGKFDNIKIQGMSSAVPEYIESNTNFTNVIGKRRVKKQIRITGVEERHVSGKHQRTSDLCYAATLPLLEKLQWKREEIKVLLFITQGPNYNHPSTAFFLHKRLGLGKDCLVYDMNLGCSSFNVGVHAVSALLQTCETHDKALLLIGDTAGMIRNPEAPLKPDDIAHDMLFGSAGAAIAIEKVEKHPLYFMNMSDGNGYDAIIGYKGRPSQMDGAAVFSFAINDVSDGVIDFRKKFEISEDDIDHYVFHQAQDLILDNIIDACDIPAEKELRSLRHYGNTSGTSVPVTVCANREEIQKKKKSNLLLCGFGVGLSWGCIYTEIDTENILPIIETNEHYDEDKKPANGLHDKNILVLCADTQVGEWLSRFDNSRSAMVILAGKDSQKLKEIQSDLFLDSDSFVMETLSKETIHDVLEHCKENDWTLDGVVIPTEVSADILSYLSQELASEYGKGSVPVVVLESVSTIEELEAHKQEMESRLKGTSCKEEERDVRVNGIVYVDSQMDIVQITRDGKEWVDLYLERECPENMKKPIYISWVQNFLLTKPSRYITETVIAFNN